MGVEVRFVDRQTNKRVLVALYYGGTVHRHAFIHLFILYLCQPM